MVACGRRQFQFERSGCIPNLKRLEQGEIVIDRVHLVCAAVDKFVVNQRAQPPMKFDSIGHNAFCRARKESEQRRAIVSREIDTAVEPFVRYGAKDSYIIPVSLDEQSSIDIANGGQERGVVTRHDQCYIGVRKLFAERRDGWRGQNQIADTFDLEEKNVHAKSERGRG